MVAAKLYCVNKVKRDGKELTTQKSMFKRTTMRDNGYEAFLLRAIPLIQLVETFYLLTHQNNKPEVTRND
jgi:hypothetical protein